MDTSYNGLQWQWTTMAVTMAYNDNGLQWHWITMDYNKMDDNGLQWTTMDYNGLQWNNYNGLQ